MNIGILGAGLSGISLAYFLQDDSSLASIDILEKERTIGGLCRSFDMKGIFYDVGPHILFSKDQEILRLMLDLLGDNVITLRRLNRIFYHGRFVKYPFENELSSLSDEDRAYCLNAFLNNPYEAYEPQNMLQFFLATFGEGITNSYLRPYNEKIWKFDPVFMDTQMVERIPKPPREDILRSAEGHPTEGYLHQLYFQYPRRGGIASLIEAFARNLKPKASVQAGIRIDSILPGSRGWRVQDQAGKIRNYDILFSTIPLPDLNRILGELVPHAIRAAVENLKYNSIVIVAVRTRKDRLGDCFAVTIPDKNVIFHRLSRINFMGGTYVPADDSSTLLVEITYRRGDLLEGMPDSAIEHKVVHDLEDLGFIEKSDYQFCEIRRFPYGYVVYDLNHRKNLRIIRQFFETELGIFLNGRFGTFEYLNMDAIVRQSKDLSIALAGRFKTLPGPRCVSRILQRVSPLPSISGPGRGESE